MIDSVELLSSMSPKIKNKLNTGERKFRRVAGASILALKKNIRRSSIYDKYIATLPTQNLNIVDSRESCTQSDESKNINDNDIKREGQNNKCKLPTSDSDSVILISDSDSDSISNLDKLETQKHITNDLVKIKPENLLSKEKVNDISNWIDKVVKENNKTCSTVQNELSTVCYNDFVMKTNVHSTFAEGKYEKIDEFFVHKNTPKSDESIDIYAGDVLENSLQHLVIEDSFQMVSSKVENHLKITSKNKTEKNMETPEPPIRNHVILGNQLNLSNSSGCNEHDTSAVKVLDELYGASWRANKELILSKTEPKNKIKKPSIRFPVANTERKPTLKSTLNTPNLSNLKVPVKSEWVQKLNLCDSDTSRESSEKINNYKKSNYFKKITKIKTDSPNKENENLFTPEQRKNERSSRGSHDNKIAKNSIEKSPLSEINSSCEKFNYITTRRVVTKSTNVETTPENIFMPRRRSESYSSLSSEEEVPIDTKLNPTYTTNTKSATSIKTKKKTDKKEKAPIRKLFDSSSDEECSDKIDVIKQKSNDTDRLCSFLTSLSANVSVLKADPSARIFRNNFKTYKDQLLQKLFKLYNDKVFNNLLSNEMLIEWNDRMRSSAGFCYCKKITQSSGHIERSARIVLSTKVVDKADRLRDTLIHEMCHAATWIVNCVSDGHGHYWKSWADKAMKTFPELPNISRCHNYAINTKYTYRCTKCGYSFGRHSKSLDIERKRCGYCFGKFELLVNRINKKGETKVVSAKKEATGFALFVKDNYGLYRTPDRKHGDVMKILGQKFQATKL